VAFEVCKLFRPAGDDSPPSYHVNVDPSDPEDGDHTCECRGHLRHTARTGKPCRHVAALLALIEDGQLTGEPIRPACGCGSPAAAGSQCLPCHDDADYRARRRAECQLDDL
jgi:hypothetical protein